MKIRAIIIMTLLALLLFAGCSGSSGITPERNSAVVGIVGDPGEFPELDMIAGYLESEYGSVRFISPGEYPAGMKYIFVTGHFRGPRYDAIGREYFGPEGIPDLMMWPTPLVMRMRGLHDPGVRMIIMVGRNRAELMRLFRHIRNELDNGRPFDWEDGEWEIRERELPSGHTGQAERAAQWGFEAHQSMASITGTEMGYADKTRHDVGTGYAIEFYYNGELKHTSYIAGDETPMELIIRGSWECDIVHDHLFTGIFENFLYRKLGHAWFPPDGWVGSADDFAMIYGTAAGWALYQDKDGKGYYFLGLTLHLMEDVGIPLHTKPDVVNQLLWHTAIEEDLDEFWFSEIEYALHGQPVHSFTDLRAAIETLGTASNADFDDLIDGYVWGWLWGYDEYYAIARSNAVRTTQYLKGLYQLAEPYTW